MHHDGGRFQRGALPSPLCYSGTPVHTDACGACWVCGTPTTIRRSSRHAAACPAAGARRAAAVRRCRSQPAGRALSIAGVACSAAPCVVCVRRRARLWVWRRQGRCWGVPSGVIVPHTWMVAIDAARTLRIGLFWELNPGPLAPKARIIPLDQTAQTQLSGSTPSKGS